MSKLGEDKGAVEIMDEAVHLLRDAPSQVYWTYLVGALPFALMLLWFVAEMSWSAFAAEHLLEYALALAALFVWKQCWEAVFSVKIHELLSGSYEPWTVRRAFRMIAMQAAMQPLAFLVLPLAALTMLPFATAVAYFRNLSLYAGFGSAHAGKLAREQSIQWTRQNWILQSLLSIVALLLFVNYIAAMMTCTQLAKSILGVENTITRYPMWLLTSTGFCAIGILVYVTLDPLVSAIYVLRCFYGQSIQTGADVRASFRRILSLSAAALVIGCCLAIAIPAARAQTAPVVAVDAQQLEKSIGEVVRRREFTWRMPKQDKDAKPRTGLLGWLDSVIARLGEFWDWLMEGLKKLFESDRTVIQKTSQDDPWAAALRISFWVLGAVFVIGAAVLLYKQRQARKLAAVTAASPANPAPVDLRDESLTADKLPENSWLALAQEWIDKGDLRLALRALHLAGLSYLNGRNLVTIQRWKSGMEYCAEVARRGRGEPAVGSAFQRNTRVFEAGWYGRHEVSPAVLEAFSKGLDEVRSHGNRL